MLNILIISDEAKDLYALFRTGGFSNDVQGLRRETTASANESDEDETHDIGFLDLDTKNWQERLLDLRHRMSVVAFSRSSVRMAVEAMRLGASDYLEKPLNTEVLAEIIARHKKRILSHKYGFDEIIGNSTQCRRSSG